MDLPRPWLPTHRLTWSDPTNGERHRADVRIVHHADEAGLVRLAYTRDDDAFGLWPTWRLRQGEAGAALERYED